MMSTQTSLQLLARALREEGWQNYHGKWCDPGYEVTLGGTMGEITVDLFSVNGREKRLLHRYRGTGAEGWLRDTDTTVIGWQRDRPRAVVKQVQHMLAMEPQTITT